MTQNTSSVKERVRQGARQWESERASANVRVKWCERWEVPYTRRVWCAWERMSWEKWRLADESLVVSSNIYCYWAESKSSYVPQLCHFNTKNNANDCCDIFAHKILWKLLWSMLYSHWALPYCTDHHRKLNPFIIRVQICFNVFFVFF